MADARFLLEDKAALDIWYIMNASLWLDITILLRTLAIVISGDRVNGMAVKAAHARLEEMRTKPPVEAVRVPSDTSLLARKRRLERLFGH